MWDGQDVGIRRRGWIGAGTLEQDKFFTTRLTCRTNCFIQLRYSGHAGGDNQWLTSGGHASNQLQVGVLKGRDLVARHIEAFEKIHRRVIERSAEWNHT